MSTGTYVVAGSIRDESDDPGHPHLQCDVSVNGHIAHIWASWEAWNNAWTAFGCAVDMWLDDASREKLTTGEVDELHGHIGQLLEHVDPYNIPNNKDTV